MRIINHNNNHLFAFYYCQISSQCISQEEELFHRIKVVLRAKQGDKFLFFDDLRCYQITITLVDKKKITFAIDSYELIDKNCQKEIIAFIPLLDTKYLTDAMYFLGKTFINKVYLVQTSFSRKKLNVPFLKLRKCLIQGAEESKNFRVPLLHEDILMLKDLLNFDYPILLLHENSNEKLNQKNDLFQIEKIGFFCGPEEGLAKEEVAILLKNKNIVPVSLYNVILKSIDVIFYVAMHLSQ